MKLILILTSTLCLFAQDVRADESDDLIRVIGRRKEALRTRKTGQSLSVQPSDESRFDTATQLKRESSVIAPETGRIAPSGFVVPRIRGQDVKLTDLYLADTHLQDPYSGLPLVEDLDLRAFGAFDLHLGVPPPDLPGLNPIGTLRYRFRPLSKDQVRLGSQFGQPFGAMAWGLAGARVAQGEARLYARAHETSGRYKFYSDEGTPYNVRDDKIRTRENNDQHSAQVLPFAKVDIGKYTVQGLGWFHRAVRGLPSNSVLIPSFARENSNGHLASLQVKRRPYIFAQDFSLELGGGLTHTGEKHNISDPGQHFLVLAERSTFDLSALRGNANATLRLAELELYSFFEGAQAEVRNTLDTRLANSLVRKAQAFTLGLKYSPISWLTLEGKGTGREHQDGGTANTHTSRTDAFAGSLGFHKETWGFYLQSGFAKRLPSLLEEFGNGSTVQANPQVAPETLQHREFGFFLRDADESWRLGMALYRDWVGEKIVLVPVLANAMKALNVQKTDTTGFDLRGEWEFVSGSSVFLSLSRMLPYDKTRAVKRVLPGIPKQVAVLEYEQKVAGFTWRWLSRYRNALFRDLGNTIELPGSWISDTSLDYRMQLGGVEMLAAFSVKNVFNLMSVPIRAPGAHENVGRTAYSDYEGAPLPGRQWVFGLSATL